MARVCAVRGRRIPSPGLDPRRRSAASSSSSSCSRHPRGTAASPGRHFRVRSPHGAGRLGHSPSRGVENHAPRGRRRRGRAAPLAAAGERGSAAPWWGLPDVAPGGWDWGLAESWTEDLKSVVTGNRGCRFGSRGGRGRPGRCPGSPRRRRGRGSAALASRRPQYGLRHFRAPSPASGVFFAVLGPPLCGPHPGRCGLRRVGVAAMRDPGLLPQAEPPGGLQPPFLPLPCPICQE